jgi:hypothetical protein
MFPDKTAVKPRLDTVSPYESRTRVRDVLFAGMNLPETDKCFIDMYDR